MTKDTPFCALPATPGSACAGPFFEPVKNFNLGSDGA